MRFVFTRRFYILVAITVVPLSLSWNLPALRYGVMIFDIFREVGRKWIDTFGQKRDLNLRRSGVFAIFSVFSDNFCRGLFFKGHFPNLYGLAWLASAFLCDIDCLAMDNSYFLRLCKEKL